jgi:hypothetical protein
MKSASDNFVVFRGSHQRSQVLRAQLRVGMMKAKQFPAGYACPEILLLAA